MEVCESLLDFNWNFFLRIRYFILAVKIIPGFCPAEVSALSTGEETNQVAKCADGMNK